MSDFRLDRKPRLLDLVEPLYRLAPPAFVCDKFGYSAFGSPRLRPG